jgi:hypothetical protein
MKFNSSKAFTILFLVIISSCSNNATSATINTANATASTTSPYQLRLNQSSSWVKGILEIHIEGMEKALQARNRSLYSSGETPSTILVCSMKRFEAAFATLDEQTVIESYDQAEELFPIEAMLSWIKTCSEAS